MELTRLRWRMRGAWMWPAFAAFTVLDGVLIHERPLAGDATGLVPALILASVFNLIAVAVLGRMGGWLLRRRRRDLPAVVAHDYAGTACLFAVAAAVAVAGQIHRPAVDERRADFAAQAAAVRRWVLTQAPPEYRRNLRRADSLRLGADLYRTCVPGPDPRRALCLFVNTDQHPPGVRVDPNREPNESFARAGQYAAP
ncbi:MAG TPA: hypothetical protein VNB64_04585 [Solirubrobacteraceae bacterium]|nr:hypothetical protein [Solirubrobacteraceae bacterium]